MNVLVDGFVSVKQSSVSDPWVQNSKQNSTSNGEKATGLKHAVFLQSSACSPPQNLVPTLPTHCSG